MPQFSGNDIEPNLSDLTPGTLMLARMGSIDDKGNETDFKTVIVLKMPNPDFFDRIAHEGEACKVKTGAVLMTNPDTKATVLIWLIALRLGGGYFITGLDPLEQSPEISTGDLLADLAKQPTLMFMCFWDKFLGSFTIRNPLKTTAAFLESVLPDLRTMIPHSPDDFESAIAYFRRDFPDATSVWTAIENGQIKLDLITGEMTVKIQNGELHITPTPPDHRKPRQPIARIDGETLDFWETRHGHGFSKN